MRIVGHRGTAGTAPENTVPSFRKGLADGAAAIELDVRLSRDGVVVCFHDDRIDRVTPGRGSLADFTSGELAGLPILPGAFDGAFPEAHIPTLEKVYASLPPTTRLIVELKTVPEHGERLVDETLRIVASAGAEGRTRIISFDHDLLRRVHRLRSGSHPSLGVLVGRGDFPTLLPCAVEIAAEAVHPPHTLVDEALLGLARDRGFLVNAWTVNTVEAARRLAELGVDEITTDYPARLRELGDAP